MDTKLFELFIKHTTEKKVLVDKIIELIKPNKSMAFLDCGCGTGDITLPIAKLVKRTVAIDVDDAILKKISEKDNIQFIKTRIQGLDLKEKFDFALISHIWYHIKSEDWGVIIKNILNHLKANGKLILVGYGESEDTLIDVFGPIVGFEPSGGGKRIAEVLNNLNIKFKDYKLGFKTEADSIDQMFKIKSCFFEEKQSELLKFEKEIKKYLEQFKRGTKVIINSTQHMLIVDKPKL